jgi:hypothetical protein
MDKTDSLEIVIRKVRALAENALQHHNKTGAAIQENFLLANDRFAGIRFACGPFEVHWNCESEFAALKRGSLTIQQFHLTDQSSSRRAA